MYLYESAWKDSHIFVQYLHVCTLTFTHTCRIHKICIYVLYCTVYYVCIHLHTWAWKDSYIYAYKHIKGFTYAGTVCVNSLIIHPAL